MKNKFWVLLAIAAMILISCGTDSKDNSVTADCKYKSTGGHGLSDGLINDEGKCEGTGCAGLKSYGTITARPEHKDIRRVGPLDESASFTNTNIQNAANIIMGIYNPFTNDQKDRAPINKDVKIFKDGVETEYKGGLLKVLFNDPNIASFLDGKAGPAVPPVLCPDNNNDGNGHLGVGETCIKDTGDCTGLQDYRTADMSNETHVDYFQWPIYRVGAVSNYGTNDLTTTTGNVLEGYKFLRDAAPDDADKLKTRLDEMHITYNAPGGQYTWVGKNLGVQKNLGIEPIAENLYAIALDLLTPVSPVAQLQPTSNVRMAKGKKSTEQFPVIAGGADKDPKVNTGAQNFRLNRQAIARNNRNVKSLL